MCVAEKKSRKAGGDLGVPLSKQPMVTVVEETVVTGGNVVGDVNVGTGKPRSVLDLDASDDGDEEVAGAKEDAKPPAFTILWDADRKLRFVFSDTQLGKIRNGRHDVPVDKDYGILPAKTEYGRLYIYHDEVCVCVQRRWAWCTR